MKLVILTVIIRITIRN